ncbi:MAG TPA: energy-coupling factor transporter transmembrane component T [Candidatus Limnocylindrales bacterium]|nr:energy-coupling factor transporter transmembrane component T [Candidatus Limnocylindrales bacterium]
MRMTMQYYRANTVMHRMDALTKFLWIILLGVLGFTISDPLMLAALVLALVFVTFGLGRLPAGMVLRMGFYFFPLSLAAGFFQMVIRSHGTTVLAHLGPLAVTSGGLQFGAVFGLRIMLIAFASLIFVWTTDPRDLIVSIIYLRVPYRIAYAVFVALRFVPLLENEAAVIREAQSVRGVEQVHGRIESLKRYVLPLLLSAIRKSENTAVAMDSRAFGAFPTRTYIKEFRWTASGIIFLMTFAAAGAILIYAAALRGNLYER